MKKLFTLLLALIMCASLCACKSHEEKRLEELTKASEEAARIAEEAEREYEQLLEYMEEYEALQTELDSLPEGSAEYERVLEKNNRLVKKMVLEYPELASAVEVIN